MMPDFRNADFESLASVYNACAPDRYPLDADLLRQNSVECPVFDWGASCISPGAGFAIVKKSAAPLYDGPDQDVAHLSLLACTEPNVGIDLMRSVKTILRDRGIARLTFGSDSRHFFPGCPVDHPVLRDFLIIQGFVEGGETHDLERDLADYVNPAPVPDGDVHRPLTGEDLPKLEAFFAREFPGRWRYDVMTKVAAEDDPSVVFGLFRQDQCEGFALLQHDGCRMPISGATWRGDLGPKWGALGPIGVSRSIRGQGSGNALLGKALEHLRDLGCHRTIIDWTGLVQFYGAHGFVPTRTYRSMTLGLE